MVFANGMTVDETIVTIDDDEKRVVWSATGGNLTHHNASAQVFEIGSNSCKVVWVADLLPNELCPAIAEMIEQGLFEIKRHAESNT